MFVFMLKDLLVTSARNICEISATQPIDFAVARDGDKTTLDKVVAVSCAPF